jgi:hypothetical protein
MWGQASLACLGHLRLGVYDEDQVGGDPRGEVGRLVGTLQREIEARKRERVQERWAVSSVRRNSFSLSSFCVPPSLSFFPSLSKEGGRQPSTVAGSGRRGTGGTVGRGMGQG